MSLPQIHQMTSVHGMFIDVNHQKLDEPHTCSCSLLIAMVDVVIVIVIYHNGVIVNSYNSKVCHQIDKTVENQ